MKILIVPDVHGSHEWEKTKEKINEVDKIIFSGDYFDTWENKWPDQGENFKNICSFKRQYFDKVILLIGNHDFSYISGGVYGSNCSGHQYDKASEIRALLTSNLDIIDLAFECDGWVFSHAGFSKTAVGMMNRIMNNIYGKEEDFSISRLNKCWHERSHFHGDPNFDSFFDEKLDWDGMFSGSGDEKTQFCLWIRPHSLLKDAYYQKQVVGHTEYCIDDFVALKDGENYILLTDSRTHSVFDVFDTEKFIEPITEIEFEISYKKKMKQINDLKSLFGSQEFSEEEKMEKIKEVFGEKAKFYLENYFKE